MAWKYSKTSLNNLSNSFSYTSTKPIDGLSHKQERNEYSNNASRDDISRSVYSRSHSRKSRNQWKYNQNSSKSEEFFIFIFYPSKQWHHSDTHSNRCMIRRETARRHKFVQESFIFQISQSQKNIWSDLIHEKLDPYIYDNTHYSTRYDIERCYFIIKFLFGHTIYIQNS